jgi:hypothetical protein
MLAPFFLNPLQNFVAHTGTWEPYDSGEGCFLINSSNTVEDKVSWDVPLEIGTYELHIEFMFDEECCEATFYMDGVEIGKLNEYKSGTANEAGEIYVITGIKIATRGDHKLECKVTKQGSAKEKYMCVGTMEFHE